jgi:hypothetical protein
MAERLLQKGFERIIPSELSGMPIESWDGMSLGNSKNVASKDSFDSPYCSIYTQLSTPQIITQIASITISTS